MAEYDQKKLDACGLNAHYQYLELKNHCLQWKQGRYYMLLLQIQEQLKILKLSNQTGNKLMVHKRG